MLCHFLWGSFAVVFDKFRDFPAKLPASIVRQTIVWREDVLGTASSGDLELPYE